MPDTSGWQVTDSAPRHYQDEVRRFMDPFADLLVAAAVVAGDEVLDVACGTGFATRAAARTAGNDGRVIGTDINGAMLELAAAISIETGDDITWQQASAMDLPFDDEDFNSVICQQGVQFFPDPPKGLAEMARVTRVGGSVGLTVWSEVGESPYLDAMHLMALEFCGADASAMKLNTDEAEITAWFARAGIGPPVIQRHTASVALPPMESFIPAHMKATPWAVDFDALSQESTNDAIAFMREHIGQRRRFSGATVPFSSLLATAIV